MAKEADLLERLLRRTKMTDVEAGRIFGVQPHHIDRWLRIQAIPHRHHNQLQLFSRAVNALGDITPTEAREKLFVVEPGQHINRYAQLIRHTREDWPDKPDPKEQAEQLPRHIAI